MEAIKEKNIPKEKDKNHMVIIPYGSVELESSALQSVLSAT